MANHEEDTNKERIAALEKRIRELETTQQKHEEQTQNALPPLNRHRMYCPRCQRNVTTEKDYSLLLFISLLFLAIIPATLYYILSNKVRCPTCKTSEPYLQTSRDKVASSKRDEQEHTYCSICGYRSLKNQYCDHCRNEVIQGMEHAKDNRIKYQCETCKHIIEYPIHQRLHVPEDIWILCPSCSNNINETKRTFIKI